MGELRTYKAWAKRIEPGKPYEQREDVGPIMVEADTPVEAYSKIFQQDPDLCDILIYEVDPTGW